MYDTPFRSYDAQLGRFHQIDPLADSQSSFTPYHFGYNDPVYWSDPTGLDPSIDLDEILRILYDPNIAYGGSWSAGNGWQEFNSAYDALWRSLGH
jgi:uncharacterized protein RhaS with RHS repeats